MFQSYAVTYQLENEEGMKAVTSLVDLDDVTTENTPERIIRTQIAVRRYGRPAMRVAVQLNEVARLGQPTETP